MAKLHLDRLKKKYPDAMSGENYRALMSEIIASNTANISRAVLRLQDDKFKKRRPGSVILPDVSDVLPKRSVFSRKAADRGKIMTDNLRDKITADLRSVLEQPGFVRRRGSLAGTMKTAVINEFQKKITETFQAYTKRNPKFGGVPGNVKIIAVTETRSAVSDIKHEYMNTLIKKNPDQQIMKTWRHNDRLVRDPREHHREISGFEIPYNKEFIMYNKKTGRTVHCMRPHDPSLPAEEVIGCQCELTYRLVKNE